LGHHGGTPIDRYHIRKFIDIYQNDIRRLIVGDLQAGRGMPESADDCFIFTEALSVIYDVHSPFVSRLDRSSRMACR
jgi:hypothetical protein